MSRHAHLTLLVSLTMFSQPLPAETPMIIAHRGASGYLPEHTIPAKVLAHAQGAHYLEQDVVLTRDNVPIVLHDIHLDRVTDVAEQYPQRHRADGRFYAIDFNWDEVQRLHVTERVNEQGTAVFPTRYPVRQGTFRVPSLEDELGIIAGLNHSTGRLAGIYLEIKQPAFHRQEGKDISRIVLGVLHRHGYRDTSDACYVQCFDPLETRRLREELDCRLKIIQLLHGDQWLAKNYHEATARRELELIAQYAEGIGPALSHLINSPASGEIEIVPLVTLAHEMGLLVHTWTARKDDLPQGIEDWRQLHQLLHSAKVDGLFSDFPGDSRQALFNID